MVFGLTDSFVRKYAVCTEVFHAVQTARRGLGRILAVGAFGGILDRQHCQHVVYEEVEWKGLDSFGGDWDE